MLNLLKKNDSHFFVVLRGSAYALFAKILIIAFGFLNNILVARYYGAELIGILSIVQTLLTLLSLLALIGFNQSVLATIPKESLENRYFPFPFIVKVAIFVITTSSVLSCLTYLGLDVFGGLGQKIQLETALQVGAFFIVIYALRALFLSFFRAIGAVKFFTILQLVTPVSNFCILLIIIIYSFNGLWVVYARLISAVIAFLTAVLFFLYLFRSVRREEESRSSSIDFCSLLKKSLPLCGVSLLVFSTSKISILIYSLFATEISVGYYSVAVNTAILINVALGCVNSMVAPKFAELHARMDYSSLFSVGTKTTRLICIATIPLTVVLLLFGRILLEVIYGMDFSVAYFPMAILAIGNCLNAIAGPNDIFLQMTGDQGRLNKMMWIGFAASLIFYMPFIYWWGSVGAALAVVVGQCIWNYLAHSFILKKYENSLMLFYSSK